MALEKLRITPFQKQGNKLVRAKGKEISVLFNPNSYSITKSVMWSSPPSSTGSRAVTQSKVNAPILSFGGGGSRQLTLELFFDVTEPSGKPGQNADVRTETNKIAALTRIERDQGRPPVCEVSWGKAPTNSDFPFIGVVSNLTQRFTLFMSDGRPVRAILTVVLLEFLDPGIDKHKTDPELTTRVVKRGDTLSSIAAEVYLDPALWRIVAEANQVDDPRQLQTGSTLTIPKLS